MKLKIDTTAFTRRKSLKFELYSMVETLWNNGLPFMSGALFVGFLFYNGSAWNFIFLIGFAIPAMLPLKISEEEPSAEELLKEVGENGNN